MAVVLAVLAVVVMRSSVAENAGFKVEAGMLIELSAKSAQRITPINEIEMRSELLWAHFPDIMVRYVVHTFVNMLALEQPKRLLLRVGVARIASEERREDSARLTKPEVMGEYEDML